MARVASFVAQMRQECIAASPPPEFVPLELKFKQRRRERVPALPATLNQDELPPPRQPDGDLVAERKFVACGEQWTLHYVKSSSQGDTSCIQKTLQLQKRGGTSVDTHRYFRVAYICSDASLIQDATEEACALDGTTVVCKVSPSVERRLEDDRSLVPNVGTPIKVVIALLPVDILSLPF